MNTLLNPSKKEFTEDHRTNYNNFNKSDIFNKNVTSKENELVSRFKNKFKDNNFAPRFQEETAFSRKLNEFHDPKAIENSNYSKVSNVNRGQGYVKPQFNDYEERKVERDLTPKEKKLFEQNPRLDLDRIKNLKQKNMEENMNMKKTQGVNFDFNVPNSSTYNKVNLHNSNIFNNEEKAKQINDFTNKKLIKVERGDIRYENGNYDIINNNEPLYTPQVKTGKRRANSMTAIVQPYVSSLVEDKSNPRNKKLLNLVSEFDDFYKNGNFQINDVKKNEEDNFAMQNKQNIKSMLDDKYYNCKRTKVDKVLEQTSNLFRPDFYDTSLPIDQQNRQTYKFELVPTNNKDAGVMSAEEVKLMFAKKGFHAFDVARNEQCNDPKDKENIKISIRKNNAFSDDKLNNLLKEEAMKNGFDIKRVEEKAIRQKKVTDVVPTNMVWNDTHLTKTVKSRLASCEGDQRPATGKITKNNKFTTQVDIGYKNRFNEIKKK